MTAGEDLPEVNVWEDTGPHFRLVGSVAVYTTLKFTPTFNDPGDFEIEMPYDSLALKVVPGRLYSIDWRGTRSTFDLDRWNPSSDGQGGAKLTAGGPGVLGRLGWDLAWPNPDLPLGNQPEPPVLVTGPCETVIKTLVASNFVSRRGEVVDIPGSTGLGATRKAKPRFDNLLELVTTKANLDGLGVDLILVNITASTAKLRLRVWQPPDRSDRVHLSEEVGTVGAWSQTNTAPDATKILVGGAGTGTTRVFDIATSPEGNAAAATWGGHRVKFSNQPQSYDLPDLDEAGQSELDSGASTTNATLTAVDAKGQEAFTHYNVGDTVTGELSGGVEVADRITSIPVAVDVSGGVKVNPTFGDPNSDDPEVEMSQMQRALTRRVRRIEQGR